MCYFKPVRLGVWLLGCITDVETRLIHHAQRTFPKSLLYRPELINWALASEIQHKDGQNPILKIHAYANKILEIAQKGVVHILQFTGVL